MFGPWVENDLEGESILKISGALLPLGVLAWGMYHWQRWRSERQRREWRNANGDELTSGFRSWQDDARTLLNSTQ